MASNDQGEHSANPSAPEFAVKKLSSHFVDEVANISISPNGACRLQFCTWSTDENNKPVRVDSEVILTMKTLQTLSNALPKAIAQADALMQQRAEGGKPQSVN